MITYYVVMRHLAEVVFPMWPKGTSIAVVDPLEQPSVKCLSQGHNNTVRATNRLCISSLDPKMYALLSNLHNWKVALS